MSSLPLAPGDPIRCECLSCTLPARICVLRQEASRRAHTRDTWRGQAATFPTCTAACAQGQEVRAALAHGPRIVWRGAGPGRRFEPGGKRVAEQLAARRRLQSVGLLEPVPTVDDSVQQRGFRTERSE